MTPPDRPADRGEVPRPDRADTRDAHGPPGQRTVFDDVGGMPAFEAVVESFYARVERDDLLRPMYPEDLTAGKRHLALFLAQYWGGGQLYGVERGHPRLRMRHAAFPIAPQAAQRWATLMSEALLEQGWPPDARDQFLAYVERATPTLTNRFPTGEEPGGAA